LKKYNLDPNVFKAWRGDKLKALWKLDKGRLIEALRHLVVLEKGTRFGGYKS